MIDALPAVDEHYRDRRTGRFKCPACLQIWYGWRGFVLHMRKLHHRCRFCVKAYIMVDHHEKRMHTAEYAIAAGACSAAPVEPT